MNRGMGTPQKDAESLTEPARATKSGRKVKRPAHFDDSPETKKAASASACKASAFQDFESPKVKTQAEKGKKSARKTLLKDVDDTPSKNGAPEPETTKKSARKTLSIDEPEVVKKSARKVVAKPAETTPAKEKTPEPEVVKKSARKTLLKSAVKNSSVEQEKSTPKKKTDLELTEDKKSAKQNEPETIPADAGTSRTGRKIKVPAHLKEFEDVVVASPKKEITEKSVPLKPEEKSAPKTPGRAKSLAVMRREPEDESEEEKKPAPKTPGRGRSLAVVRKEAELEQKEKTVPSKSPVIGKSLVLLTKVSSVDLEEDKAKAVKTPARGKSLVVSRMEPEFQQDKASSLTTPGRASKLQLIAKTGENIKTNSPKLIVDAVKETKVAPKTPLKKVASPEPIKQETDITKRGKSSAPESIKSQSLDDAKTPSKRGKSMILATRVATPDMAEKVDKVVDNLTEPISRSGRKIKPKKYFGEFEEEEPVSIVAKPVSPVKPISRASPLAKKESPAKPKVVSPVKRPSLPIQEQAKKDVSPPKKIKLNPQPTVSPKLSKISPNTEERQITIRGGNDHHQKMDENSDHDPLVSDSKEMFVTLSSDTVSTTKSAPLSSKEPVSSPSPKASPKVEKESEQKIKRGRKTLPASDEQAPPAKAPKTPSRRMTTAVVTAVSTSAEEAASNSRSGRKIKPKKFFGEDETPVSASASKAKAAVKPEGGRGRRKTLAVELSSDAEQKNGDEENKLVSSVHSTKEEATKPEPVPSHDEILAVMGASQSVVSIASDMPAAEKSIVDCNEEQQLSGGNTLTITETDQTELDREDIFDSVEAALEENFQDTRIEQTAPAPLPKEKVPPNDPAPLVEQELLPQLADSSDPAVEPDLVQSSGMIPCVEEAAVIPGDLLSAVEPQEGHEDVAEDAARAEQEFLEQLAETKPPALVSDQEDLNTLNAVGDVDEPVIDIAQAAVENPEISANSCFSEALQVEEELAAPENVNNSKEEHFECLEFLENSAAIPETEGLLSEVSMAANATFNMNIDGDEADVAALKNQAYEEPADNFGETPAESADTEDDLNNTEPPQMDDIDPTNSTFTENDRDNESIIVIPDTPMFTKLESPVPAAPKTPESKADVGIEKFSPDKPDDQHQPSVPQVIEIFDSPIAASFESQSMAEATAGGSCTSTPLKVAPEAPAKLTVRERIIQNSRKRSLSASEAEISKKNVTFHSPANSTILVDTIDERLKKSVNKIGSNPRKRSLSEHKDLGSGDGVKPAKVTKLPNFKSIHQQHFKRMESIQEFHNRKIQRAKVLARSGSKSPVAASLIKKDSTTPHKSTTVPSKSPFKTGNGTTSSSETKSLIARPKVGGMKTLSDTERVEKRQQQFQAAFKPKIVSSSSSSSGGNDTPDGTRRVIEQSRHKQSQILKGVRTNKRFELLMKFRDSQD